EKLAHVVRALLDGRVLEDHLARPCRYTLVLHDAGITAAADVDGDAVELDLLRQLAARSAGSRSTPCRTAGIRPRRLGRRAERLLPAGSISRLGRRLALVRLELRLVEAVRLRLALRPCLVNPRLASFPNHIIFRFCQQSPP